jgi:succinyl-CoA synthetase beta subunit
MKIHEYQAKELLRKYGVVTPRGFHCVSVDAAVKAAEELGGKVWVVKAQIHAGGRGKGGGVKLARRSTKCASTPTRSSACSWSPTRPAPKARRCAAC